MTPRGYLTAFWAPRTHVPEALLGAVLVGRSMGTLTPGEVPESAYRVILSLAPQAAWGWIGIVLGVAAIIASGRDLYPGHPVVTLRVIRFLSAAGSAFISLALAIGFATAPMPVPAGVGLYSALAAGFLYCAARIMAER